MPTTSSNVLVTYATMQKLVCLIGDFNLPELNWKDYSHPMNEIYNLFTNFIDEILLHQFVEFPTLFFKESFIETQKRVYKLEFIKERIALRENSRKRTSYYQVWEF